MLQALAAPSNMLIPNSGEFIPRQATAAQEKEEDSEVISKTSSGKLFMPATLTQHPGTLLPIRCGE